jgi:hypothetical protein
MKKYAVKLPCTLIKPLHMDPGEFQALERMYDLATADAGYEGSHNSTTARQAIYGLLALKLNEGNGNGNVAKIYDCFKENPDFPDGLITDICDVGVPSEKVPLLAMA